MTLVWVALGGSLGALLRYLLQSGFQILLPRFPLGTLVANLLGAFAIGVVLAFEDRLSPNLRPFLVAGVLGSLTTLSSFAGEVMNLLMSGRYVGASVHWFGNAVVCLFLCYCGFYFGAKVSGN